MHLHAVLPILYLFIQSSVSLKASNASLDIGGNSTAKLTVDQIAVLIEKYFKSAVKEVRKVILPIMMETATEVNISSRCVGAMMKFMADLSRAKVWTVRMLDATSKVPPGTLEGTMSDYGDFDECLDISVPLKNGTEDFRGQFCAFEAKPHMPSVPKNFTGALIPRAGQMDTVRDLVIASYPVFYFGRMRGGICLPSACSMEDVRVIAKKVAEITDLVIEIPQCSVKESVKLEPVHYVVIVAVSILVVLTTIGTYFDARKTTDKKTQKTSTERILLCFSFPKNARALFSTVSSSKEMPCLHGLRVLSLAYVLLCHEYMWHSVSLLKHSYLAEKWFQSWSYTTIDNGWLSVETFFFISGVLTCYIIQNVMVKTKGKINVTLYIIRRYIRLVPAMVMMMGLAFFLPIFSSGPFWYEIVDEELDVCRKYWWTNILLIGNWLGIKKLIAYFFIFFVGTIHPAKCISPTWYLTVDYQLHIFAIMIFFALYRSPKLGITIIVGSILAGMIGTGLLTYIYDLPPYILVVSGNEELVYEICDKVYVQTITHVGPYCVGVATGYFIFKKKNIKFNKWAQIAGWSCSFILCSSSLYGSHFWGRGDDPGLFLSLLYAGAHKTVHTIGVAWVAIACISGYGGIVNKILSASVFFPLSRLTYNVYLLHGLVFWAKLSTERERTALSHYNFLYEVIANMVTSVLVTIPFYLLLQAPLSNVERLVFSGVRMSDDDHAKKDFPTKIDYKDSNGSMPKLIKVISRTAY